MILKEAEIEEIKSGESNSEKYYPSVVINALVRIMRDSSLGSHYRSVIDALMPILKGLGVKGAPTYLPQIMPPYIQVFKSYVNPPNEMQRSCVNVIQHSELGFSKKSEFWFP